MGEIIPPLLTAIGEPAFSTKPAPEKWSKKEIIGHLIDSATNNHQRFVRAQFEPTPQIYYDQNKWNEYSYYDRMEGALVIASGLPTTTTLLNSSNIFLKKNYSLGVCQETIHCSHLNF